MIPAFARSSLLPHSGSAREEARLPPSRASACERLARAIGFQHACPRCEAEAAEKARLEQQIRSQGLWTSQENLLFHETEGWLFEKWSRKAASGEA